MSEKNGTESRLQCRYILVRARVMKKKAKEKCWHSKSRNLWRTERSEWTKKNNKHFQWRRKCLRVSAGISATWGRRFGFVWVAFHSHIFIYIFCKSYSRLRTHNSWRLAFGEFTVLLLVVQYCFSHFHSVCVDLCIILGQMCVTFVRMNELN